MQIPLSLCLKTSGRCLKQNNMAYKVIELIVPEHDIQEQEHWYYDKKLTRKAAMEWFDEQVKAYQIEKPEKYLLRILNFTDNGYYSWRATKDIVRTID